eukprot:TRINITY_DN26548_c0_g1_i1.p1 TRINITY_DN26548_c0_g1~~TRINITY_DN26548_c0_g1_i1.p1  ORF type:complete len:541 (+),score=115.55 TRINITY_DN26548_c0_g1_i1:62-1684(+)
MRHPLLATCALLLVGAAFTAVAGFALLLPTRVSIPTRSPAPAPPSVASDAPTQPASTDPPTIPPTSSPSAPPPPDPRSRAVTDTAAANWSRWRSHTDVAAAMPAAAAAMDLAAPLRAAEELLRSNSGAGQCGRLSRRVEYTHRKQRRGEVSNEGMVAALSSDPSVAVAYIDNRTVPGVVAAAPRCHSADFRIDQPFGGWKSVFRDPPPKLPDAREPQRIVHQPPTYVAVLRNSFALRGYAATCSSGVAFGTGGCLWQAPGGLPERWRDAEHGAVVVGDTWVSGYFHWTHEHLPRVALAAGVLSGDKRTSLVVPLKQNFQREWLEILGVDPSRAVSPGKASGMRFPVVYFPQPQRCGNVFTATLYVLRRIVFDKLSLSAAPVARTGEKLCVLAERKRGSRMPRNYPELRSQLESTYGGRLRFRVHLGMPVRDQVSLFNSAALAIGPHGANLANIIFMRPGAHVVEMVSHRKANMCYYTSSQRVGLVYHMIPHGHGKDSSYYVSWPELRQNVDEAVADLLPASSGLTAASNGQCAGGGAKPP